MSPTPLIHAKVEPISTTSNHPSPSQLKLHKDSHLIKKSSPASSSSTSSLFVAPAKPQQRHPVIIYTHSPKIIHTHPKDFMALVQKLTGRSRDEEDDTNNPIVTPHIQRKCGTSGNVTAAANSNKTTSDEEENKRAQIGLGNDDNESSSALTDENCSSVGDVNIHQENSCFLPPIFEPHPNPYVTDIPVFMPNSADFLMLSNQPFYNRTESLFFPPNIPKLGIDEFREDR